MRCCEYTGHWLRPPPLTDMMSVRVEVGAPTVLSLAVAPSTTIPELKAQLSAALSVAADSSSSSSISSSSAPSAAAAAAVARKLVHGSVLLRGGTLHQNGVGDNDLLVLLPPRRGPPRGLESLGVTQPEVSAAPSEAPCPSRAQIRAATAPSAEAAASEERRYRATLLSLTAYFRKEGAEDGVGGCPSAAAAALTTPNSDTLQMLLEMGFPEGCDDVIAWRNIPARPPSPSVDIAFSC
eukprot:COSAG01_NODE_8751_length_2672_cov_14.296541_1_plen_238_part_00